jgi:hypothetical protein
MEAFAGHLDDSQLNVLKQSSIEALHLRTIHDGEDSFSNFSPNY